MRFALVSVAYYNVRIRKVGLAEVRARQVCVVMKDAFVRFWPARLAPARLLYPNLIPVKSWAW